MGSLAEEPIIESGVFGDLVTAGTAASGLRDAANALTMGGVDWDAVGGSGLSSAFSVLGGLNTFMTHDPNVETGPGSMLERTAMGGIDAAFGLLGGPAAVVDSATGGNTSGFFRASTNAAMVLADGLIGHDTESMENFSESATSGNFGAASGGLAVVGDALGQGLGMLSEDGGEFDLAAMENFSDGMQSGSELNPMTHAARAGDWLGDVFWDLFGDDGESEPERPSAPRRPSPPSLGGGSSRPVYY